MQEDWQLAKFLGGLAKIGQHNNLNSTKKKGRSLK